MSLLKILRSAVAIADKTTKSLQSTVKFQKWLSNTASGGRNYATARELQAIVDLKQQQVRSGAGVVTVARAVVTFLDINALLQATNQQGIHNNDRIVLPDGTTGPILNISGFVDRDHGNPVATEVYLG